jgi:tetratricopeptide (TPR) repeat protein
MMQRLTRGGSRIADPPLTEARALKRRATALRNRGELGQAQEALDEAIRVLATLLSEHTSTATDAGELRAELADTYGMKGGIFRRAGEPDAALKAYETGAEIEESDKLGTTYNRSNVITLSITEKGLNPTGHEIRELLANIIRELESETAGARRDEWWAWSDLGQFYLLNGEPDKARACYSNTISKTGATADEIRRHVTILGELAAKTAATAPGIAASISAMVEELSP